MRLVARHQNATPFARLHTVPAITLCSSACLSAAVAVHDDTHKKQRLLDSCQAAQHTIVLRRKATWQFRAELGDKQCRPEKTSGSAQPSRGDTQSLRRCLRLALSCTGCNGSQPLRLSLSTVSPWSSETLSARSCQLHSSQSGQAFHSHSACPSTASCAHLEVEVLAPRVHNLVVVQQLNVAVLQHVVHAQLV